MLMSMTAEETTNFVEEAHLQDVCRLVARRRRCCSCLLPASAAQKTRWACTQCFHAGHKSSE